MMKLEVFLRFKVDVNATFVGINARRVSDDKIKNYQTEFLIDCNDKLKCVLDKEMGTQIWRKIIEQAVDEDTINFDTLKIMGADANYNNDIDSVTYHAILQFDLNSGVINEDFCIMRRRLKQAAYEKLLNLSFWNDAVIRFEGFPSGYWYSRDGEVVAFLRTLLHKDDFTFEFGYDY